MASFPQVSPPKPCTYLSSPQTCYMPPPPHLILHNVITQKILHEEYRSLSSSLCSFHHSPVTSSLLGPNILLSILFSNTLSLCSSLNVSDQVSNPNSILLFFKNIGMTHMECRGVFEFSDGHILCSSLSITTATFHVFQQSLASNLLRYLWVCCLSWTIRGVLPPHTYVRWWWWRWRYTNWKGR